MPNNIVDDMSKPFSINLRDIFEYKWKNNNIPSTVEVIKVQTNFYPHIITVKNIATGVVTNHSPEEIQADYIKKTGPTSS